MPPCMNKWVFSTPPPLPFAKKSLQIVLNQIKSLHPAGFSYLVLGALTQGLVEFMVSVC